MSDMLELLAGVEKIKTVKPVFSPLSLFSLTEMDTSRLLAFFLDPQGNGATCSGIFGRAADTLLFGEAVQSDAGDDSFRRIEQTSTNV